MAGLLQRLVEKQREEERKKQIVLPTARELSEEANAVLESADVIISKGQGNFETLQYCGLNAYYIFMCKCNMFAKKFNKPLYSGMLINDKDLK